MKKKWTDKEKLNALGKLAYKIFPQVLTKSVYDIDENNWCVYRKYYIRRMDGKFNVSSMMDDKIHEFNALNRAVAWCILYENLNMYECNRLRELDTLLHSVAVDIEVHTKLKNKGDIEKHVIYANKLQADFDRQRQFRDELDKYINKANSFHNKGLQNELTRFARK